MEQTAQQQSGKIIFKKITPLIKTPAVYPHFSFVLSQWKACYVGLGCLRSMCWLIFSLYSEAPSNQLCSIWLNLSRKYTSELIRSPQSTVAPSVNSSEPVPRQPCVPMPSHNLHRIFTEDVVCFGSSAGPVRLHSAPRWSHLSRDCSSRARLPPSEPFHQVWFGLSIFEADVWFSPCVNPMCSLHLLTMERILPSSNVAATVRFEFPSWEFFPQNIQGW